MAQEPPVSGFPLPEAISQDPGACVPGAVALGLAGRYPEILDVLGYKTPQELYKLLWIALKMDPKGTDSVALKKSKAFLSELLTERSKDYVYFFDTTILLPGIPRDEDKPNDPKDPNLNWVTEVDRVMAGGGVVELGLTLPGGEGHCALLIERPLPRNDGGAGLVFADDPNQSDGKAEIKRHAALFSKRGKSLSEAAFWLDYIALEEMTKKRKPVSSGGGKKTPGTDSEESEESGRKHGEAPPKKDDPPTETGKKKKETKDGPNKEKENGNRNENRT